MAFPRSLALGMCIGHTHLQSGQPFHMHPGSNYNSGYLQPSLYLDAGLDKHVPTSLLQQAEASFEVALSVISQLIRIRLLVLIITVINIQSA